MKNLKLKKIQGSNIINFLDARHCDFNIMSEHSYGNDAEINFNKIANNYNSLKEFKQALESLQVEDMVHSTYFNEYLFIEQYGELVKNLDSEEIVHLVNVENLTHSKILNNENGEELESYHDLQKSEIEFLNEKIKNSINRQLNKLNYIIEWVDNYNNFIDNFVDSSMFDIAEFIAQDDDFDYLHGLTITNADDLYLNEDQEVEMEELKSNIEKIKHFNKLKQELTSKQAPAKKKNKI